MFLESITISLFSKNMYILYSRFILWLYRVIVWIRIELFKACALEFNHLDRNPSLVVRPWTVYLNSLCCSFAIYKIQIVLWWASHPNINIKYFEQHSPGDLPNPGIKPMSPTLQVDSLLSEPPWKPKSTRVGSLSLLQGIFLTQESNRGLLHCRRILYQLLYQGSPVNK